MNSFCCILNLFIEASSVRGASRGGDHVVDIRSDDKLPLVSSSSSWCFYSSASLPIMQLVFIIHTIMKNDDCLSRLLNVLCLPFSFWLAFSFVEFLSNSVILFVFCLFYFNNCHIASWRFFASEWVGLVYYLKLVNLGYENCLYIEISWYPIYLLLFLGWTTEISKAASLQSGSCFWF